MVIVMSTFVVDVAVVVAVVIIIFFLGWGGCHIHNGYCQCT